eukprot:2157671-Prymnesium_polylepis.1
MCERRVSVGWAQGASRARELLPPSTWHALQQTPSRRVAGVEISAAQCSAARLAARCPTATPASTKCRRRPGRANGGRLRRRATTPTPTSSSQRRS